MRRRLGRTGIEVTPLGYGAMEIFGPGICGRRERQAERILNAALDAGINFLDTAYDYGLSEEYIGRFISRRRNEYFLATKCGCTTQTYETQSHLWTRENLLRNIDASLRRLKTDHVDVWQLHNPSVEDVQAGDLAGVMEEVKAAGKVRWIGASSTLPHITTLLEWRVFDTFQIPYSALDRTHDHILTEAARTGAGTIIRGGVARGAPGLQRRIRVRLGLRPHDPWAIWQTARLDELRMPGESRTAFVLRFAIAHPDAHTIIVGTLNPEHLAENLRAAETGPLSAEVYAEARRRLNNSRRAT